MQNIILANNFADIMGVSKATLNKWEINGTFVPRISPEGKKFFYVNELIHVPEIKEMVSSLWK